MLVDGGGEPCGTVDRAVESPGEEVCQLNLFSFLTQLININSCTSLEDVFKEGLHHCIHCYFHPQSASLHLSAATGTLCVKLKNCPTFIGWNVAVETA